MKAIVFAYQARTKTGEKKEGIQQGTSREQVYAQLEEQGLYVYRVKEKTIYVRSLKMDDKALLFLQLGMMLHSGLSIQHGLGAMEQQSKGKEMKYVLSKMTQSMTEGKSLYEALQETKQFTAFDIQLIKAGEMSGTVDQTCRLLAIHYKEQKKDKEKWQALCAYPLFIIGLSLVFALTALFWIFPIFVDFFTALQQPIPPFLQYSVQFVSYSKEPVIATLFFSFGILFFYVGYRFRHQWQERLVYACPPLRKLAILYQQYRMAQMTGLLLKGGVPLYEAIETMEKGSTSKMIQRLLFQVEKELEEGYRLGESLECTLLGTPMFIQLIKMGEEAGELERALEDIAQYTREELLFRQERWQKMAEPTLLLIGGAVVLGTVLSIAIPMFRTMSMTIQ